MNAELNLLHVDLGVKPWDLQVVTLETMLEYEYIGLYGEPDPNPEGGLGGAWGETGSVILLRAYEDGPAIAMCGITMTYPGIAVLRRMFTTWKYRRRGLAKTMLAHAEEEAKRLGANALWLETGTVQVSAIALYASQGYTAVEPFGYYAESPESVFLGKDLSHA